MKCAGCLKVTKDANSIKCTSVACEKCFCMLCVNGSSITSERRKTWKCPDCCAIQKRGGDNTLTPVRATSDSQNVTARRKHDSASDSALYSCAGASGTADTEIKDLTAIMTRLTNEFTALKTKLEEVTHSLIFCQEKMEELQSVNLLNENRLRNLEKRDHEVTNLQATVAMLQNELKAQTQQNLMNEMEILGIPESNTENLDHIIKIATMKLGVKLEDGDVDWITRVGSRRPLPSVPATDAAARMPRPVVVRLLRRSKRDQIVKAAKSRKNITSTDLDITGTTTNIFFNERLTKDNRILFHEARARAKVHNYTFCWCNRGAIYIRQRQGLPAKLIRSLRDLDVALPPVLDSPAPHC